METYNDKIMKTRRRELRVSQTEAEKFCGKSLETKKLMDLNFLGSIV